MKNTKMPAIRFKRFNDDWEQRKLGELISEYKKTVDSSCTLPVLTSSKTEGVILQEEHFGRKQQHDITGYNVLPRSYCTYRNRSDGVDFTFNVNECCDMGIISKFYPVFCGNDNDTYFLSLVLNNSDEVVHEIAYTCTGTGQKVLSFLDLQKMSIRAPLHNEQKKISAYFKQLDHLITLHQRKLKKIKIMKKSMLEKMFPRDAESIPKIRFDGYTDDWEQRKMDDVVNSVDTGKSKFQKEGSSGMYAILGSTSVIGYDNEYDYEGDFLLTARVGANAGSLYRYVGKAKISDNTVFIQASKNIEFLYHLLTHFDIKKLSFGTGQPLVKASELKNLKLFMPADIEEQTKIGEYFQNLDHLITLHQRKLEKLKKIKKSLLEHMFPMEK